MAVLRNVLRKPDENRERPTLGVEDSADFLGINYRTFKDGLPNRWIVAQAVIEKRQGRKLKRKPILGFDQTYLSELKPIFKDVRQGAVVWTDKRIAACKKISERWENG